MFKISEFYFLFSETGSVAGGLKRDDKQVWTPTDFTWGSPEGMSRRRVF